MSRSGPGLIRVANLAALATTVVGGRSALRSFGARRLAIGLLGSAAVVGIAARILVPRGRNTRRMGVRPDALGRPRSGMIAPAAPGVVHESVLER